MPVHDDAGKEEGGGLVEVGNKWTSAKIVREKDY